MFGNFIYFIVALLIYTTYQPPPMPDVSLAGTLLTVFALTAVFAVVSRLLFKKLEKKYETQRAFRVEDLYNSTVTRLSILALGIYAFVIYVVNLGAYLQHVTIFKIFPTLEAVFFLGLFLFYLSIVWALAYDLYEKLNRSGTTRWEYVVSNISFSIPVLLPWFCLSVIVDFITALPFETPKNFLMSTEGQIVYFLVFLFVIAIIGPALIQRFWGCRPLEEGYERHRIERMCDRAGISYRNIMLWPMFGGKTITAGVMGIVSRFRYILVTPGLLQYLSPVEVDAVIAHEIGHVKKKHLIFYLFFFVGYLVIAFSTLDLIIWGIIYMNAVSGWSAGDGGFTMVPIMFSFAMILIFLFYFRYVFGYFMRNFERQADGYVYQLMDSAQPLIATFNKIAASSGQSPDQPNWHHFSITQRIDFLRKCESSRVWIDYHNRKIRFSIFAYVVLMIMIGLGGYQLHAGGAGETISTNLFERIVAHQIEKSPENPELHLMLADLYQGVGDLSKSVSAYQKAISLEPDNARALNNLAWLYATATDSRHFQPEKALDLALRAARISKESYIMDTLAESYYVNGKYDKAVSAGKEALSLATEDKDYYRRQVRKFEDAARHGVSY
jgi:Zn-dependent protease with chaperone function